MDHPYNKTQYAWGNLPEHLIDLRGNDILDIASLQQEITEAFQIPPPVIFSSSFYDALVNTMNPLNPLKWFPTPLTFVFTIILILLCILCMLHFCRFYGVLKVEHHQ